MPAQITIPDDPEPSGDQEEWYSDLVMAAKRERPRGKALGRCLGDFIDEGKYEFGLPFAELLLLRSVLQGTAGIVSELDWHKEQDLKELQSNLDFQVRASFLRFLVLGGDDFVSVHDAGIELSYAYIDAKIDLRGGACVRRLILNNCYINGALSIEDASLGILVMRGSHVAGISGNRAKIAGTVFLDNDFVSKGIIAFYRAEIGGSLQCSGGHISDSNQEALVCTLARISGDVSLNSGFESNGEVALLGARIGGNLECGGGKFENQGNTSIQAGGVKVDGSILLRNGFESNGEVALLGAHIGGDLDCDGGKFTNPEGTALYCGRARISGNVFFRSSSDKSVFKALGSVSLDSAEIGGLLNCYGGSFMGQETRNKETGITHIGIALDCSSSTIKRGVSLGTYQSGPRFQAKGLVSFAGANIEGQLQCSGGSFKGVESVDDKGTERFGTALDCSNATLKKGADLGQIDPGQGEFGHRFEADGTVWFYGAQIEGRLQCLGGSFKGPDSLDDEGIKRIGIALNCATARIKDVALSYLERERGLLGHRFEAQGEVSFQAAQIDVHLDCAGGKFNNPTGVALRCQAAKIGGCVFLRTDYSDEALDSSQPVRPPFEAFGRVTFVGTSIGLQFDCQGGQFENRQVDRPDEGLASVALDLGVATIKDALRLGVNEATMPKRRRMGVLSRATPEPTRREPATVKGALSLNGAAARVLVDYEFLGSGKADEKGMSKRVKGADGNNRTCYLELDGFTYERIEGSASCKAALRQKWLARQPPKHLKGDFRPQPFEQLVKVLRAMGHGHDADQIAISKRRHLRKARPWRRVHVWLPEHVFLDLFLGYGYRLIRALAILVVIGAGYAWFYEQQAKQGAIVPAKAEILKDKRFERCHPPLGNWVDCRDLEKAYVPFNAWLYSANVMLPIFELGQKAAWEPAHGQTSVVELPIFGTVALPSKGFVYYMQCLEIGIGWLCSILLGTVFGLVKRE